MGAWQYRRHPCELVSLIGGRVYRGRRPSVTRYRVCWSQHCQIGAIHPYRDRAPTWSGMFPSESLRRACRGPGQHGIRDRSAAASADVKHWTERARVYRPRCRVRHEILTDEPVARRTAGGYPTRRKRAKPQPCHAKHGRGLCRDHRLRPIRRSDVSAATASAPPHQPPRKHGQRIECGPDNTPLSHRQRSVGERINVEQQGKAGWMMAIGLGASPA